MLITNILLGVIIFMLIIIFGALCNIDRKMSNTKEVRELLERVKDKQKWPYKVKDG